MSTSADLLNEILFKTGQISTLEFLHNALFQHDHVLDFDQLISSIYTSEVDIIYMLQVNWNSNSVCDFRI